MVHGFVKQSGGHVRIYSEEGHGTTVKIYLPRLLQAEEVSAVPAARPIEDTTVPRARQSEAILVVEDNGGVRDYAKVVLSELGYRVLEAGDANEALRLLAANSVDLLFTDVVLPGPMTGRPLADKASKMRPGLPILFTTGYTQKCHRAPGTPRRRRSSVEQAVHPAGPRAKNPGADRCGSRRHAAGGIVIVVAGNPWLARLKRSLVIDNLAD